VETGRSVGIVLPTVTEVISGDWKVSWYSASDCDRVTYNSVVQ